VRGARRLWGRACCMVGATIAPAYRTNDPQVPPTSSPHRTACPVPPPVPPMCQCSASALLPIEDCSLRRSCAWSRSCSGLSTMQHPIRYAFFVAALVVGALVGSTAKSQARPPEPPDPTPGAEACFTCSTYKGEDGQTHTGCVVVLQSNGCTSRKGGGCDNGTSSCTVNPY
jgi:hypothetical protein